MDVVDLAVEPEWCAIIVIQCHRRTQVLAHIKGFRRGVGSWNRSFNAPLTDLFPVDG